MEMRLEHRDGLVVAVPAEPMPTLTAGQVREVLEQSRR
jgi:predicted RNA binding protein YcfA (HicA-like mRNA interferase family)